MAEQVNQRIEDMINELEQMQRTNLYTEEEIREISRKRKEFEYKVQRRVKHKEDYTQYITYELTLLQDIALRRKLHKMNEKKKDIEYAVAKRLNRLFKQFIYRFQNDIAIYFEYIKFCSSVGFDGAVSGIIGQMLQIHGDKPRMWQLAAKWESKEKKNLDGARSFLLKGIHRHQESEILYLDLFEIELLLALKAEDEEDRENLLKRAEVIFRNGIKNITNVMFLFSLCEISMKYGVDSISKEIKAEIWSRRDSKEVWTQIANMELQGQHWQEIEEFQDGDNSYTEEICNYIAVYEEALQQFPDKSLFSKYIHGLLGLDEGKCTDLQKISIIKQAWLYGHENGLLTDDMYTFGIEMLKVENVMSEDELMEILNKATKQNPQSRHIWAEKLYLNKANEKKTLSILQEAHKVLKPEDSLHLWNLVMDSIESKDMLPSLYKKFQNCENTALLAMKPKLLQKMYDYMGLQTAREAYRDMIKSPPTQIKIHQVMIDIEKSQEKPNVKNIRKCYESAVQQHGTDSISLWMDYMKFETENGSPQAAPAIYRRAIAALKKDLVDEFIKAQTLANLESIKLVQDPRIKDEIR